MLSAVVAPGQTPPPRLPTTPADFVQPGTQPSTLVDPLIAAVPVCQGCHGLYRDDDAEPWDGWVASMMAQAARDPLTRAAATIANRDAAHSAETCIRCHAPIGWLDGRSANADFGDLVPDDYDGVGCIVCHRQVDPVARADAPSVDADVLETLAAGGTRPGGTCRDDRRPCAADADCTAGVACDVAAGQGRYVIDPFDRRRGPFDARFAPHDTITSPYHRRADVCAPCHDVSTPTLSRQDDGRFVLNELGAPHPTQDPHDMFPEQRTFSEWRLSTFASDGVVFPDGRFGGAKTALLPNTVPVSTCQDCHMPDVQAPGANVGQVRPDLPLHTFAGANTWVLGAVLDMDGPVTGLTEVAVAAAGRRTVAMLRAAADLELTQLRRSLRVRVVNQTGHKLPTGYPEGRRMWLTVRFLGEDGTTVLHEDGRYDDGQATLDLGRTTKVYEVRHVVDAALAATTGLAADTPFHLVLSNAVRFDNRIPPRGFAVAPFAAAGAAPVGAPYADGQFWDDTVYAIPDGARRAEVALSYQTTTREYAEFLRDTATDGTGQRAYDGWVARGRSAPVVMSEGTTGLVPCAADSDVCCGTPAGASCDDGDPCTAGDVCSSERCDGVLAGFDGLRCELGQVVPTCTQPLRRKAARLAKRRVASARKLVAAAERRQARPGAARRLLQRAGKVLDGVQSLGEKYGCGDEFRRRLDRGRTLAVELQP